MNEKLKEQSLDVVAGDHPALNTLAVNPTPWNICPVCKNQADVDDDASDGSQIRCHECNADLVVVEFGNPDGSGSAWELHVADGKEGAMQPKTSTPVDAPDIVERLRQIYNDAYEDIRDNVGSSEKAQTNGIRAVIAELAAMGGGMELCPEDDELADVFAEWASRKTGDDERSAHGRRGVAVYTIARGAPILAAKDATIAEQAREIERLAAKVDQLEGDRHDLCGMYRSALDKADIASNERDAAFAEVARLKAGAEAMARRVRILEIAPKAAWWANDKLGCGVLITDADNAAQVIAGVGANATDDWAKAVLEYVAREGGLT